MAQEFTIKSENIESKINQLLPSQGGFGAGVDFSASTMVIPIVDLTETAEGSVLRQDLQSSLSFTSVTAFEVQNTTSTLVNTTGYYKVFGAFSALSSSTTLGTGTFSLTDGFSTKKLINFYSPASSTITRSLESFDFLVYLVAGVSLTATSSSTSVRLSGSTRQIADINGNLVNP